MVHNGFDLPTHMNSEWVRMVYIASIDNWDNWDDKNLLITRG